MQKRFRTTALLEVVTKSRLKGLNGLRNHRAKKIRPGVIKSGDSWRLDGSGKV